MLDAISFSFVAASLKSSAKSSLREVLVVRGRPGNTKSLSQRTFLDTVGSVVSGNPKLEYLEVFEINILLVSFRKKYFPSKPFGLIQLCILGNNI